MIAAILYYLFSIIGAKKQWQDKLLLVEIG
jgi:hypothetical protein